MSKRIKTSTILKWIGSGASIVGIAWISYLIFAGVLTVGDHSANEYCGGDTVCWLEVYDACFNEDYKPATMRRSNRHGAAYFI